MRKTGLIYLLMLLIPAVLLGIGGIVLLANERHNLANRQHATQARKASVIAAEFGLHIREILNSKLAELNSRLAGVYDPDQAIAILQAWEQQDTYVRNVFIWDRQRHLLYPDAHNPATDEQAAFIQRYSPLFSGMEPWPIDLASMEGNVKKSTPSGGWIPWYAQNRLHLLGWQSSTRDSMIFGLELETVMLLGAFIQLGTELDTQGMGLVILDGNGQPVFQSAGLDRVVTLESLPAAAIQLNLSQYLPHWRIVMIPTAVPAATSGYLLIAFLLLAILVVGLLVGGTLLWRHGYQMRLESRRKSDFVSNVSHELKTPLTSIRMYAEMLHEGRAKPEKQNRYLEIIVAETQRLTRLVNNVLDFSRIEQGRKHYDCQPIDLDALIREELDSQSLHLEQANIQPHLELMLSPACVKADRDAVEQVLINLVDNALKYAGDAGDLTIRTEADDDRARLYVEDRGPGVPASHQTRIFHAFHRVDDSLSSPHAGTGLGLSICYRLVTDQGGTLHYRNRQGGGASFCVTLPLETVS